jgi:hypothetical protein
MTTLALVPALEPEQRSLEWLERHQVVWDRASGVLPSIIIGVYRRASTMGQIGGYRQQNMIDDMTDVVLRKGPAYGVIVFDEGNRSGTTLSGRAVAQRMIAALERGIIQGIAAPDVKRLCRDEWLGGGREMARALRKQRGILILDRGDELNLRKRFHLKAFMHELKQASDEIGEITYTMYSGIVARARRTAEGKVEPMFRGPAPYGYRHVECRDEHGEVIRNRGVPRRTLEKNPLHAHGIELLIELLNSESSINRVAIKLNQAMVGADIHTGEYSHGWTGQRVRGLLDNPAFHGVYHPVRERKSDIWEDFDEIDVAIGVPQLQYWTETEAQQWLEKFSPRLIRRPRLFERPFIGVLVCSACKGLMQSAGHHGYRCRYDQATRQARRTPCNAPQVIAPVSVEAALRGLFAENIGRIASAVVAEHQRQLTEQVDDPVLSALVVLDQQEASLLDLVQGGTMSDQLRQRYAWIQGERARLQAKQARQGSNVRLTDEQVAFVQNQHLHEHPLDVYDEFSPAQQAELWRMLGVTVAIYRTRGRGKWASYRAEIQGESLSERSIWILQSFVTGAA